ncbi:S41 family peptidase [Aliidiomarina indica]|uniref:S41 family peptidase n=1 Tax=Aliidiomarina indica TaxID=2749147 RepID=UPI00188E9866|nr:S41 family peptidase [Aliidiomarina indica]
MRNYQRFAFALPFLLVACGGTESAFTGESPLLNNGQCSVSAQNQRLKTFMERSYLWNTDMPTNVNPNNYNSIYAMLDALRAPQDIFSFILTEQEYRDRFVDAVFFGFGFGRRDNVDEGVIEIRYVYANSPAEQAGLNRGDRITAVENVSMAEWFSRISAGTATFTDVFGPNEDGIERRIDWVEPDGTERSEIVRKTQVETNTVMATERFQVDNKDVGYFVFDSFLQRSEVDLNNAFDQLIGVDELVIDLRYNSGGLVRVANQLASQAAWNTVENEVFVTFQYNDNFNDQDVLFNLGPGIERLNVNRVYVLTTQQSCSSSELVINSLDPHIEVVTIGAPTCGKPVGQQPTQICDKIIYAITFQTVNSAGFGDYFDGLPVTCAASDTIVGDWGDSGDPLLATAFHHIENGSCGAMGALAHDELLMSIEAERLPLTQDPILTKFETRH